MKANLKGRKLRLVMALCVGVMLLTGCEYEEGYVGGGATPQAMQGINRTVETPQECYTDDQLMDVLINNFWEGDLYGVSLYEFFDDGTGYRYDGFCEYEEMNMTEFTFNVRHGQLNITLQPKLDEVVKTYTCDPAFFVEERPAFFDTYNRYYLEKDDVIFYQTDIEKHDEEYYPFYIHTAREYNCHLHPTYPASKAWWKDLLVQFLEQDISDGWSEKYCLAYIDDDDIPELIEYGKTGSGGMRVITVSGGSVKIKKLDCTDYSYIERGNIFKNSGGVPGNYYDSIYQIQDGVFVPIFDGRYYDPNGVPTTDEYGNSVYEYYINGQWVSYEDYYNTMEEVMPSSEIEPSLWSGGYKSYQAIKQEIIFK